MRLLQDNTVFSLFLVFLLHVSQLSVNVLLAKSEPAPVTISYIVAFADVTFRMLHTRSNPNTFLTSYKARLNDTLQL